MQNNLDLQQNKNIIKQKIYPFIDEMVEAFYNDDSNNLIKKVIETVNDKSIFLMFVMMYYSIQVSLKDTDIDKYNTNKEMKKSHIKFLMNELIQDPEKRKFCIEVFASKFQDIIKTNENDNEIENNKRLFLKNN